MSLRDKTVNGLGWSFADNFGTKLLQFGFGVVLARLLTPQEYGLLGIVVILVSFAQVFVDSGFSQALLRKTDCRQEDYNNVFFFNVVVGAFLYGLLYVSAQPISRFFGEPELVALIRVVCLVLIVNSTSIIQRIMLARQVDFKTLAKYSLGASVFSNGVAIVLAMQGFGVWSLGIRVLVETAVTASLLWWRSAFRLSWRLDCASFGEMFGYSSKLLLSGILDCLYKQMNMLVIGKLFRVAELGYYTRASQFTELPSTGLTGVVARVTFPVFAQMDNAQLKEAFKKIQGAVALLVFSTMIGMAAVAPNMIAVLLGERWLPSVLYLQLLSFSMMFYPIHAMNLQVISVRGFSSLYLKLEVVKKLTIVPVVFAGIQFGIVAMLVGMIVASVAALFLNSHYTGSIIDYSTVAQLKDLLPVLGISLFMGALVYGAGLVMALPLALTLVLQILIGVCVMAGCAELFRLTAYLEVKRLLLQKWGTA